MSLYMRRKGTVYVTQKGNSILRTMQVNLIRLLFPKIIVEWAWMHKIAPSHAMGITENALLHLQLRHAIPRLRPQFASPQGLIFDAARTICSIPNKARLEANISWGEELLNYTNCRKWTTCFISNHQRMCVLSNQRFICIHLIYINRPSHNHQKPKYNTITPKG